MRWDIFCKVIDNHGDAGVCWRLAAALGAQGETVRLWIDDSSALAWMAPAGCEGVSVVDWTAATVEIQVASAPAPDVLIEAFGCDPAPEVIRLFARQAPTGGSSHRWINLEYLSAEPYVERLHGLPSPVFRDPGAGLTKHFFYPGFTTATGGLLREPELAARRERFDRGAWLAQQGIPWEGERLVSLFCYEPPALEALLAQFERSGQPTRLLVTAGRAAAALPPGPAQRGALSISWLPYMSQQDFDHLLWACDLNFVRGEDSLVRAIWAGAPFIWQIYPQDDDAHHSKLEALMHWLNASPSLRRFHHLWNGMAEGHLPELTPQTLESWGSTALAARTCLLDQDDLLTRLRRFVAQKS
ncbi:elongation factor P maturation arginine rhamnosyltransferase EarP [Variovorax sp. J2P1-59]|uniref:elongation factor P maturation arginine rhamnosyltransferase EarP n=1 Tax=Variovorax flavidus TaxID=3053501 RepID=UPI002574E5CD|nr:elongation factor P maturation arginine rhamnosyltransferase EarP [Variovorax sp. J2P1-59]MDM0074184.1 elongation factor P maturation arginine rhamnosyltransferase EarP [Variovorax sp. J2P1-59]